MYDLERTIGATAEEALPAISLADRKRLLTEFLRGVSRTFYLTLRVLPRPLREPVGLAYLLARAADSIADTRLLASDERLTHLLAFRAQVEGPANLRSIMEIELAVADKQSMHAEHSLVTSLPMAFSMLEGLPEADGNLVQSVVVKLTRGMELDLTTFPPEGSGRIAAIRDPAELDRYIYYVAGCVGEFWTGITMVHSAALKSWDAQHMSGLGVRFGNALQLTNVLRDVPRDLRIGRCYLPETELSNAGLAAEDLLDPLAGSKARPILIREIEAALEYYRAAEEYLIAIPRRCPRLRLAVVWPILIGLATLAKLAANENWLDPEQPSKVTRGWVYRMVALSLPCVFSNSLLRAWLGRLRGRVERAL